MRKLIPEEELNLQDLIFILLFFFIIAQTLIVFKVQKDLIIPPKVDKDPEIEVNDEDEEIITVIIDEKSTVALLAGQERREILKGFDPKEYLEEEFTYQDFFDPGKNAEIFLKTEDARAYKDIVDGVKKMKADYRFEEPNVGLIADHRSRYGTVFQVNVAVQELIQEKEINPSVKWKVFVDKSGNEDVYEKAEDDQEEAQ